MAANTFGLSELVSPPLLLVRWRGAGDTGY